MRTGLHTASQSRVFLCWPVLVPAAGPACKPLMHGAGTGQAAAHQETDAAPAGDHSEIKTPGTDCARHCSERITDKAN